MIARCPDCKTKWGVNTPAGFLVRCPNCAAEISVQSGETTLYAEPKTLEEMPEARAKMPPGTRLGVWLAGVLGCALLIGGLVLLASGRGGVYPERRYVMDDLLNRLEDGGLRIRVMVGSESEGYYIEAGDCGFRAFVHKTAREATAHPSGNLVWHNITIKTNLPDDVRILRRALR